MARRKNSKKSRTSKSRPQREALSLQLLLERHLQHLLVRNYSAKTVAMRRRYLQQFVDWCSDRGLELAAEITPEITAAYQRHLYYYRTKAGRPLRFSSQLSRLVALRTFFRWLTKQKVITSNPTSELDLPKEERRLPKNVLSVKEAEAIMAVCDVNDPLGLRDRSMLETFYSTAIRRGELINLKVDNVDWERGTLLIDQGKGGKDRHVPIGERAMAWLHKYIEEVRPSLASLSNETTIYLSRRGKRFGAPNLSQLVRDYIRRSGIGKAGSCHLFRHTTATLMMEGGADLRAIQSMLGHSKLATTQIYTHVSIKHLKEVHTKTHPARLERPPETDE